MSALDDLLSGLILRLYDHRDRRHGVLRSAVQSLAIVLRLTRGRVAAVARQIANILDRLDALEDAQRVRDWRLDRLELIVEEEPTDPTRVEIPPALGTPPAIRRP